MAVEKRATLGRDCASTHEYMCACVFLKCVVALLCLVSLNEFTCTEVAVNCILFTACIPSFFPPCSLSLCNL